jgi:uncharacterized protein
LSRRIADARALFVDSSAWIAFFSARDQHHDEADRAIRVAFKARRLLITTNLVFAEVHRLLLFRAGIKPAAAAVDHLCRGGDVQVVFAGSQHHERARAWLSQLDDQTITYTDAVSFAVMESERLRAVLTFDQDFVIAGFSTWR